MGAATGYPCAAALPRRDDMESTAHGNTPWANPAGNNRPTAILALMGRLAAGFKRGIEEPRLLMAEVAASRIGPREGRHRIGFQLPASA